MVINNYSGDDLTANLGPNILRSTAASIILAAIALFGRLISRKSRKVSLNASDYTIILGFMGAVGLSVATFKSVSHGLGRHSAVLQPQDIEDVLKISFASELLYSISFPVIKTSILLLYRVIFPDRRMFIITSIVGVIVVAWGMTLFLGSVVTCKPLDRFRNYDKSTVCMNQQEFFIGGSVPNIAVDVFMLGLPVHKVLQLQMPVTMKIASIGMFMLGGFICVISGLRLYFMLVVDTSDITWSFACIGLWSVIEVNVAVVSACLPTLGPLFRCISDKWRSLLSSSSSSSRSRRSDQVTGVINVEAPSESSYSTQDSQSFQRHHGYLFGDVLEDRDDEKYEVTAIRHRLEIENKVVPGASTSLSS